MTFKCPRGCAVTERHMHDPSGGASIIMQRPKARPARVAPEEPHDAGTVRRVMLEVGAFDPEKAKQTRDDYDGLDCVACRASIGFRDIDRTEPTALCDGCAQEWVSIFARKLNELDSKSCQPNLFLSVKETHMLIQMMEVHCKMTSDKRLKWPRKLLDKLYAVWGRP